MTAKPRIAVFTLGGTIASIPTADGQDAIPTLGAEALFGAVPGVEAIADLDLTSFRQYPSGDLTVGDIIELARTITNLGTDIDGVVITQGTDTLEETSFLLSLLLDTEKPVVLTGAMRNPGLPGADGVANMLQAIQVAISPLAVGLGPLVVFTDEIHLARYVRKTHTSSVAAFESPNTGPVGWVNENRVRIPLIPRRPQQRVDLGVIDVDRIPEVAIATPALGSARLYCNDIDGLVVQAFGGGHVPSPMVAELQRVAALVPVILASRTGAGEIYRSTYGFPGSEQDLLSRGLISAGPLDAFKARLLLTMLLAVRASAADIARAFADF